MNSEQENLIQLLSALPVRYVSPIAYHTEGNEKMMVCLPPPLQKIISELFKLINHRRNLCCRW